MSSEIHIVAIITPAEGKESRVRELLIDLGNNVKQHEKDVVCSPFPSSLPSFSLQFYTKNHNRSPNTKSSSNTTAKDKMSSS
jgi:hypothetical protein